MNATPISNLRQDDISPQVERIISEMENPASQSQHPQAQMQGGGGRQNPSSPDDDYYEEQYYEYEPRGRQQMALKDVVFAEAKLPLLVAVLVLIASMAVVNRTILTYVPRVVGADGNLNMLGLVFKALVIGVVFYLATRFFF